MNNESTSDKLMKSVLEARKIRTSEREKIIADWEEEFNTAFLGDIHDTEHIEILIEALLKREEE